MNITEITEAAKNMREPKVRDMRAVASSGNDADKEIRLIANLTGVAEADLDDLTLAHYGILQERLRGFLSVTGTTA